MNKVLLDINLKLTPPTTTAQEKQVMFKNGRAIFYEPKKVREARQRLKTHLFVELNKKGYVKPKEKTPLKLTVAWNFYSKSHKPFTWRVTRPDTDNLDKMLKDVMTECSIWDDDAQVVIECISKQWVDAESEGIEIKVEELEG